MQDKNNTEEPVFTEWGLDTTEEEEPEEKPLPWEAWNQEDESDELRDIEASKGGV